MKKDKQIKETFTIRPQTDTLLRGYCEETGLAMSLIVDLAVEEYIARKRKEGK